MKNFVKEGQKLPLYGVGPYIVLAMAAVAAIGIVFCSYVLKIGILAAPWVLIFRILGDFIIALGLVIWLVGAIGSGMDDNIAENRLKTDGIYAWVRNPMYTGWWFLFSGLILIWHNAWLLLTIPINWAVMTVVLKRTEEKWLKELYGEEYQDYCRLVNRCVPWFPKKVSK